MKLETQWIRRALATLALAAAFLFVVAPVVRADHDCQKRVVKADRPQAP